MRILKKFFAAFLAVVMMASTFSMTAVEALADTSYTFGVYYGYGRTPGSQKLSGIAGVTQSEYAILGTTSGYNNSTGTQYSQSNIWSNISGVDFYYGSQSVTVSPLTNNTWVYINGSGNLATTTSSSAPSLGQNLVKIAKNSNVNYFNRWYYVNEDLIEVIHYNNGRTVSFNTGEQNATFDRMAIPQYFYTSTANTASIEIGGTSYSSTTGITTSVTPAAAPTSIVISNGTSSAIISGTDITGDVYVASDYSISDTHNSTDILRYNSGVYTFYNVSADIVVSYYYTSDDVTATFMADGSVYDTVTVPQGTTVNAPATDPSKSGHLFKGWYAEAGCVTPYDFSATLDADTTIYAKFVEIAHEISFATNFTEIASGESTATAWLAATDGAIDSENLKYLTVDDYESSGGVQISGFFDIGSGNLETVSVALEGGETVTIGSDRVVTGGIFLNTDGTLSTSKGANTFAKYAYSRPNKQIFIRLYRVEQNISISATLVDTPHTITLSGHRTFGGDNWSTETGGTKYVSNTNGFYFTTPGNVAREPDTASAAASTTSWGAGIAVGADTELTVSAVKVYYGNKSFALSGTDVVGGTTVAKYLTTSSKEDEKIVDSWTMDGTTLLKYVHNKNTTTYNFRFGRITEDVKIVIEYAEDTATHTATLVDPQGGFREMRISEDSADSTIDGNVVTLTTTNLLNYNGGSMQLALAPQDSLTTGIKISKSDGTEIVTYTPGTSYTAAYVNGFGRINVAHTTSGGYVRYFIRFYQLHSDVIITPVLDIEEQSESVLGMGVEVGGTITSYFYATVTPEVEAAEYDSYVFRAQLGSGLSQDLEALSTVEGRLVFALESIYAQCMTDKITGTFIGVKDGTETEIDSIPTGISIAEYCDRVQANNSSNTKLVTFMANMLNFGSECQKYIGHNTDDLAITGHNWAESLIGTEVPVLPELGGAMNAYEGGYTGASAKIKNAGLNVAEKIAVFFNVYAPEGIDDLSITVDGYEKALTPTGTNMYRVQLLRIVPGNYDHVYVAKLYSGETLLQTVRYSVNTYLARQYSNSVSTDLMKAIYNYGLAAEEYAR